MRASSFKPWAQLAMSLAVLVTAFGCGKDEGKKKKKKSNTVPVIESAEIDGAGNATFKFSSESGNNEFYCRIDTQEHEGEWYDCSRGSTTYNVPQDSTITFWVKNGRNGQPVQREISNTTPNVTQPSTGASPDDQAGAYKQDDGVWYLGGLKTDLFPIGGEHAFVIPEGKRIVRYALEAGLHGSSTVIKLIDSNDPLAQVSHLTPCGGGSYPSEVIRARSTPNGQVSTYCKYHPTYQGLKEMEHMEVGANHIEIGNESGEKIDFVSVSVFTNEVDQYYTKRLFVTHCGVPEQGKDYTVDPNVSNDKSRNKSEISANFYETLARGADLTKFEGFRPAGIQDGGTYVNLPVLNQYFAGVLPERAAFHWCVRDVNFQLQQGTTTKRLFIGTFGIDLASDVNVKGSKKRVEYHIIQETDSRFSYEFANQAAQSALSTLYPTIPQRPIGQPSRNQYGQGNPNGSQYGNQYGQGNPNGPQYGNQYGQGYPNGPQYGNPYGQGYPNGPQYGNQYGQGYPNHGPQHGNRHGQGNQGNSLLDHFRGRRN